MPLPKDHISLRTDAVGSLYQIASRRHDEALVRAYGKEGKYGGTASWQSEDGKRMIAITSSSFGEFWLTVETLAEYTRYELGPEGWHKTAYAVDRSGIRPAYEERESAVAEAAELEALAAEVSDLEFSRYLSG